MANEDYILRSDALEAMMTCRSLIGVAKLEAVNHIMPIPAADVEPVRHGQWIAKKKNLTEGAAYMIPLTIRYFVCSLCGREEDNAEPYCNCGAKMDREPQEEADDGE